MWATHFQVEGGHLEGRIVWVFSFPLSRAQTGREWGLGKTSTQWSSALQRPVSEEDKTSSNSCDERGRQHCTPGVGRSIAWWWKKQEESPTQSILKSPPPPEHANPTRAEWGLKIFAPALYGWWCSNSNTSKPTPQASTQAGTILHVFFLSLSPCPLPKVSPL